MSEIELDCELNQPRIILVETMRPKSPGSNWYLGSGQMHLRHHTIGFRRISYVGDRRRVRGFVPHNLLHIRGASPTIGAAMRLVGNATVLENGTFRGA